MTREKQKLLLEGEPPSPMNLPKGCYFQPRCPYYQDICIEVEPKLTNYGNGIEHFSSCHFSKKFIKPNDYKKISSGV